MSKYRVLIVDDEPHVVRVLRLTLEKSAYSVDTARNGVEALEKIGTILPDVVITDVQMPKMNGQQLCEAIRERFAEEKPLIVVMTSATAVDARDWVHSHHNIEFLEKPLSPRHLVSWLDARFDANEHPGKAQYA